MLEPKLHVTLGDDTLKLKRRDFFKVRVFNLFLPKGFKIKYEKDKPAYISDLKSERDYMKKYVEEYVTNELWDIKHPKKGKK